MFGKPRAEAKAATPSTNALLAREKAERSRRAEHGGTEHACRPPSCRTSRLALRRHGVAALTTAAGRYATSRSMGSAESAVRPQRKAFPSYPRPSSTMHPTPLDAQAPTRGNRGAVWSDASILEVLTRGGAIGAFLGLAVVMARGPFTPPRVAGLLFCLAAAAHTLTQQPGLERVFGMGWPAVWAFSAMGSGFFWTFATELFGDRPRLQLVRLTPAALLLVIAGAANATQAKGLWLAHNLFGAALMAHVLVVIWSGWRNDLVESRRRLRTPILAAAAVYAVTIIGVQISEILWRPATALSPLTAVMLLGLGLASIAALLQANPELFAPTAAPRLAEPSPGGTPTLSDEHVRLAEKLDRLMREDRAYREEGLSISGLALKLGVPEYRLRRLINQKLSHRNFNAFLNQWRLGDARDALSDPAEREVPISTIALDAGFQSLGPFNRAFKAATGLTPSEFRAQALDSGAADDIGAASKAI